MCTVLYASGSYFERGQQVSAPLYIDTWCLCKYIHSSPTCRAGNVPFSSYKKKQLSAQTYVEKV